MEFVAVDPDPGGALRPLDEASLKLKSFTYGSESIELYVDMGVGIGGDKWPAADLFCQIITDSLWRPYFEKLFNGKSIVELGAGTGLNSILIDKLFAPSSLSVTDHSSHVPLVQCNIKKNCCKTRTSVASLDWCNLPQSPLKFDIILAFECVYKEELYVPFINALESVADNKSLIFVGLTRSFCKPLFFELLRARGFSYTLIPQEALPNEYRNEASGRDVGIFICHKVQVSFSVAPKIAPSSSSPHSNNS